MVRGKKKEEVLTPEEKLRQALVPESEWPYKVPGNWQWTRLSSLISASKEKTEDFSDKEVKYIGLENIEKDYGIVSYNSSEGIKSLKSVFHEGQILYGKLRPYLNKHDIALFNGVCSTDILVFNAKETTINQFVDYFLNLQSFIEYAVANSKGINLPRVSESVVLDALCPLPPLPEQRRIVDRIESLFAKLDEAKEKAQAVVDGFENRKAAILHKAFTGELTERWRKIHHISLDSWRKTQLKEIVTGFKYGSSEKSDYNNTGLPVLRIPNIGDGDINFNDMKFFSDIKTESSYYVHENDILIIRSNGSRDLVGKCALVPTLDKEYAYASFLIKILPSDMVRPDYLVMYLNSSDARRQMFAKAKSSAGIHNINSKELGAISLSLPYIDEQFEIIRRASGLLRKEQQAKDSAEQVIVQIDTMKKSILARAFRGELGTNDPSDESAEEMLKRIL